jgi:chromosome segregation ATPase
MGGEACGIGEGTHYGCECVMRRLAEAEARAASEQSRRETAEARAAECVRLMGEARDLMEASDREANRLASELGAAETSLSAALRERDRLKEQRDNAWKDLEHVGNVLGAQLDEKVEAGQDFARAAARVMEIGAERLSAALRRAEDAEHFRDSLTAALKDALDQREALARSREEWMARCQEKSNDKVEAIERAEAAESRAEALEKALRAMLRLWDGDLHGDDFWRARAKAINDAEALLAPRTGGDAADERSGT